MTNNNSSPAKSTDTESNEDKFEVNDILCFISTYNRDNRPRKAITSEGRWGGERFNKRGAGWFNLTPGLRFVAFYV